MRCTRREFVKGGVSAFTVGIAAPAFFSDIISAQGASSRTLVVLYLAGGNDALSTLVPYNDSAYYSRRPTLAVPAADVLQIGRDSSGTELGLHPQLVGLRQIYNAGRLALIQRTGYPNSSRSHFQGTDIWGSASPTTPEPSGWLGRYLDTLPSPVDPLVGWNTSRETPRALMARSVAVPAITNAASYGFSSPNSGDETLLERTAMARIISSHVTVDRPHVAFVHATAQTALGTLEHVFRAAAYQPRVTYPNNGLALALRAVAGAISTQIGTKVFWVQSGGFDTHAGQGTNQGTYANLMATLDGALAAFYNDLSSQGLQGSTLLVVFSEFGRRISENSGGGTDHGAAGLMMAIGGSVRGGLYGTSADLRQDDANPALENNAGDVKHETDFRSVYARVIDNWLGGNSVAILRGDFKAGAPNFV